jgi:hypothetical protein
MAGKDVVCERCGGGHFYEVQVTKYLAGGSGSVEILADPNEQVFPLLICPCGFPILPKPAVGRRAGGIYETSQKLLRESIGKAQAYLNAQTLDSVKGNVLEAVAGKFVEGRVEAVIQRVDKIENDLYVKANAKSGS